MQLMTNLKNTVKIIFPITQDEDGYPPASEESLHAIPIEGNLYKINNIPFFVYGVNLHDVVSAENQKNGLIFKKVVTPSGHLTYRLIFDDKTKISEVREKLRLMGSKSEGSHLPSLISVDIPPGVERGNFVRYLDELKDRGIADYEDGAID